MKKAVVRHALGSAMALAMAMPAHAAEEDDIITVTARRIEENIQDVSISITVLNEEAIARRNIFNAGDLGAYVPSLSTNANFGPEKSSFAIRGFIQEGRTSPSVGVYFADVVAPRANTGTPSGNGAGVGSFFDLENVQVLKGPQGTLFGRNTTGGAILLVPAKPRDTLGGHIEGSLGNYDMRRISGVLNLPLSETFLMRAAVDWHKRDGYLRNRSGIGPKALGDTDYIAARLSVVAKLTDTLENYAIFAYSKSDTHGNTPKILNAPPCASTPFVLACFAPGSGFAGFPYAAGSLQPILGPLAGMQIARAQGRGDGFWDIENSLPDPRSVQETWRIINTTTWEASDTLTIKNIVSYAEFTEDIAFSLFGDNFTYPANYFSPLFGVSPPLFTPFPHPAGSFPLINIRTGHSGNYASQYTFTEELQFIGRAAGGRLRWQAGAYFEISKPLGFNSAYNEIFTPCINSDALQCFPNILGFGSIFAANIKNFYNNKGFYAQASYDLSDRFTLTGGIRYTIDKMRDTSRNVNFSPVTGFSCQNIAIPRLASARPTNLNDAACENTIRIKSDKPTWLINLDYKPNDDVLIYAKWARGYRQGSIISANVGLETWNPEKVDTFEIGAKTTLRGAISGFFNIAAFYNDFRDQQIAANAVVAPAFRDIIPPSQVIVNAGKSRIWGVEVDASARLFEGFKLDLSYAYLNTKLKSITLPPVPIFFSQLVPVADVGGTLAQSPRNRVSVTATYTLPLNESIGEISLGATFTHTDANKIHEQRFSPTQWRVRSIQLLNLNVEWNAIMGGPLDLAFFMTNATNQKRVIYPVAAYPTTGVELGYLNQPRMWGLRLKWRFGDQ
ncbi:MAG: TonB-dependent receptor [Novosphingobium sp.]|nr:TonB-dependent receptor [Novosphingobium sp.]